MKRIGSVTDLTGSQLLRVPPHPLDALTFGLRVLEQGTAAWNERFRERIAPAMLSGVSAHAVVSQPSLAAAGTGLLLGAHAHAAGWGFPVGGSQAIADALADDLLAHGGRIVLETEVTGPADLEPSRVTLLDTSPAFLDQFAGGRLPARYRRALQRFPRGNGVAKVDFALSAPVPWTNPDVALAPTVHLGGSRGAIARSEREVSRGRIPSSPFVLVTQPSILDDTRAPRGKHTLWAYVHVPAGSIYDPTEAITRQIERVAAGVPRRGAGEFDDDGTRRRGEQPERRGRGDHGRHRQRVPAGRPAGAFADTVGHAGRRAVPVLGVDPAGAFGAGDERVVRGTARGAHPLRHRRGARRPGARPLTLSAGAAAPVTSGRTT